MRSGRGAPVGIGDIFRAAGRIAPHIVRTPLERSAALSGRCGADVWLKLECFQRTGSFKLRGAVNALLGLTHKERGRGVVTASAGNHAIGVARAAELVGVRATIVVPETTSPAKLAILKRAGSDLIVHGADYDAAERQAIALARERGARYVSPYNDPDVIAGGGTIALEVLADLPSARTVIVPAGGGGLISGIALAVKAIDPQVAVYGVQSTASPALHAALAASRIVPVKIAASLADGLAGNLEPGSLTFELTRRHVDGIALVEEDEIAAALCELIEVEHILVEGSAAVAWGALRSGRITARAGPVVLVLTGRNIAGAALRRLLADTAPPDS